jgi:4-amino-4-deoxy-L-arabinose transferase-like glycosyltransferase
VRQIVRQRARFFLLAALAAVALRLLFIFRFPSVTTDSFIYGDIAKNWLLHGVYAVSDGASFAPTWIRLPGYPAFLAGIFAVFGVEHYRAVLFVQLLVDLGTCLVVADVARRVVSERAARIAFLLAALCPFLANYVAAALTETLEVFFTVLALDLAIVGLEALGAGRMRAWIGCGFAIAGAILLRPDGGLLLIAIESYLGWVLFRRWRTQRQLVPVVWAATIIAAIALAPLVPWTARNLRTLHRFEPLAPRYANEENEFVPAGFNRWIKTWIADYASVEEVYWAVPGNSIDIDKLPLRAFDSDEERDATEQLLSDYNDAQHVTPELDTRFALLAEQRIKQAPLRYYVWLPALRIADMWLRPRTEMLPSDSRWWEFDDDPKWSALAVGMGLIGLLYVATALAGLARGEFGAHLGLLLTFVVLRSLFLGTLENPEPRYTLECYPVVTVLAAAWFSRNQSSVVSHPSSADNTN